MAQAIPGLNYTVQGGDTLSTIAQQAYGDGGQWLKIYEANQQVIGGDPNQLNAGEVIHIPLLSNVGFKTCRVTSGGLNVRSAPNSQSSIVATYHAGDVLNYIEVVNGENVSGNAHWAHSAQNHYFWLGGTDHPNG